MNQLANVGPQHNRQKKSTKRLAATWKLEPQRIITFLFVKKPAEELLQASFSIAELPKNRISLLPA